MSEHDPTDLEALHERQAAAQAVVQRELQFEIDDLAWLIGSKRGRRVMHRLLSQSGAYRLSYVQGDALATAFNEGQRNIGLRLTALLMEHCGSDYALMVQERSTHGR